MNAARDEQAMDSSSSLDVPGAYVDGQSLVRKNNGRLVRTPPPHARESLLGYALRLSEANGYSTPGYFLSTGEKQFTISRRRLVEELRVAAGLDETQIARLGNSSVEDDAQYGRLLGHRVSLYDLSLRHPKICTQCIVENGHTESLWDLAWVSACPVHGCHLINRCPECSAVLTWSRSGLLKCRNGHDMRDAPCVKATGDCIRVATMMSRKLYSGLPEFPGIDSPLEDRTDGMSLYETCRVSGKLANHLVKQMRTSERNHRGRVTLASREDVMKAIADLLCGSKEDCFALFDTLSIDPGVGGRHRSYHQAFNWLLGLFPKERAAEKMPSLLRLVFSYAAEHWPDCRLQRTSNSFSDFVEDSKWLSMTAATKEIGVSENKMRECIDRGEVPFKRVSDKSNHNYIVPVEWAREQAAVRIVALDKATIRHRFSVSPAVLSSLRDQGLFIPAIKVKSGQFVESDLEAFAAKLLTHDLEEFSIPAAGQITFDGLMYRRASDSAKATLIAAIFNGEIKPCGKIKGAGLPGLLFDQKQGLRQLVMGESEVTVEEAALILDCHNAKSLVAAEHLSISTLCRGRTYVSMASVLEFDRRFASVRPLLEESDILIPTLLRIARLAKIELLSVSNVYRDGWIWFVPRERLQELRRAIPVYKDVYPPHKRQKKSEGDSDAKE